MKKESIFKKIVNQISGVFAPIINCLTAASIIKSVLIILSQAGIVAETSGIYQIFYAVSDGFFYFLPFFLAITAAKQWKTDIFISLFIPVAMLYPDLVSILENGQSLSFMGLTVVPAIYHSGVIPVLLAVGMLHFVEIICDRFIHETVRGFLKPIVCALIVLPITFLVFGPMGSWIGDALTGLFRILYDWNPVVAGAFMGFIIQPMVVIGAHWSVVPISISNIMTNGYDVLLPLLGAAVYGQFGATLATMMIYKREQKEKRRIAMQAAVSAGLGVTEPALFGITVRLPRVMLSACIAGAIGGAMVGAAGTHCISFAFPSVITCVAYSGNGFVTFMLSMVVGTVVGFLLTMLQRKAIRKQIQMEE